MHNKKTNDCYLFHCSIISPSIASFSGRIVLITIFIEFLLRIVSEGYCKLVSPAGVEPATYALGGRRAIQLCHGDLCPSIPQAREIADFCYTVAPALNPGQALTVT